jgi:hypothetical protein
VKYPYHSKMVVVAQGCKRTRQIDFSVLSHR